MEKIEPRGKYAGVKIHLNGEECQAILNWRTDWKSTGEPDQILPRDLTRKMAKAIKDLMKENPDLLKDRTPEQVAASLAKDAEKIEKQQAALASKKDWKKV